LTSFQIPIPESQEQEAIVKTASLLNRLKKELEIKYQSELDNLEELRQSILEQAFEGKLTEPVAA
jgi:type I restriction enzyme S subunit